MGDVRAAEALLAGGMLGEEELGKVFEGVCGAGSTFAMEGRLSTQVKSLDDALGGGVCWGSVVGIWGEGGEGGGASDVYRSLLVNLLLKDPGCIAAVIDTTGNFDILGLYTLILSRLRKDANKLAAVASAVGCETEAKVEDVAARVLDHVKIMRVFDFVGVREAIGEIRDGLEGKRPMDVLNDEASNPPVDKEIAPEPVAEKKSLPPKRTVVADSEDEDEDGDEMLLDLPETHTAPVVQASKPVIPPAEPSPKPEKETPGKVSFILIDNLAQVLTPTLRKDHIQATTLASTFLTTLNHLTRTHNLYTILANPASPPPETHQSPHTRDPQLPHQQARPPPPSPSIFASNKLIPSLMSILARYLDLGLLVSNLPKGKMDAKVFYSDAAKANRGKKLRGVEMVNVLEVVCDRWEGRVGAWGVFGRGEIS